jgi:hypothetical protein
MREIHVDVLNRCAYKFIELYSCIQNLICCNWGSHRGNVLENNAMQFGTSSPTFRRNVPPSLWRLESKLSKNQQGANGKQCKPWRWKQYVPPKTWGNFCQNTRRCISEDNTFQNLIFLCKYSLKSFWQWTLKIVYMKYISAQNRTGSFLNRSLLLCNCSYNQLLAAAESFSIVFQLVKKFLQFLCTFSQEPLLVSFLSQINRAHMFTPCFLKISLNILPSTSRSPKWFIPIM